MKYISSLILLVFLSCCSSVKETYFVKNTSYPVDISLDEKIDIASRVIPTKHQLEWQRMELTAFIHFGMNTFTDKAWGDGKDSVSEFYPTNLDTDQWVRILKDCGFKMVILTAKHHDGFCLWPSKTTNYSVASSPWEGGEGDVVKRLRESCDKYDLKFGVYLSPWDRNTEYYGTDKYNDFFIEQLTELLTEYGDVHEVWFDGANGEGPNGKVQEYDWDRILAKIRELQPNAVTAIMGDDVRWVGNEKGMGRETEWSVTPFTPGIYSQAKKNNKELGIYGKSKDLGSRDLIEKSSGLYWYPSEVDVSIRPEWFYHKKEDDKVKSLKSLVDIYFKSVGYNSVLLLNIPPNLEGRIHHTDETRLYEFGDYIKKTFSDNFILNNSRAWNTAKGNSYEYEVRKGAIFNTIMLKEDISKGQRIEEFVVEAFVNNNWHEISRGTTIGNKRLIRIEDIEVSKIRVCILSSRNIAHIADVGLFYAPLVKEENKTEIFNDVSVKLWKNIAPKDLNTEIYDGDKSTYWKSTNLDPIIIDMQETLEIKGFTYTPSTQSDGGIIYKYDFYTSQDGVSWKKCNTSNEFSNIKNNPITQFVYFNRKYPARYLKFVPLLEVDNKLFVNIAEIGVLL